MRTLQRRTTPPTVTPYGELTEPVILFPMTSDEFCELPESESVKLELLNGDVIAMTRPVPGHQFFVGQLLIVLSLWVKSHKLGRVLFDVLMKLDGRWTPSPDLVFLSTEHLDRVKKKRIEGPVDLAIEILSSKPELDRVIKFEAYARYGIPWYWIVDLDSRVLEEYKLGKKGYGSRVAVPFDRPFKPRLFPGLPIDLASLEWQAP